LAAARAAGTKIVMLMSTSETASDEENLEPEHRERIDAYLKHGGEDNVRGLLDYLARELAGRDVAVPPVVERPREGYFHLGDAVFATLEEYEAYLSAQRPRLMDADAPRVVLFGSVPRSAQPAGTRPGRRSAECPGTPRRPRLSGLRTRAASRRSNGFGPIWPSCFRTGDCSAATRRRRCCSVWASRA
jgi:hypothetical protein